MNSIKFFATLVLAGLCLLATVVEARIQAIYEIDVRSPGRPAFTDCMIFEDNGRLRFTRSTLQLSWIYDSNAPFGSGFTATMDGAGSKDTSKRLAIHGLFYEGRIVDGNAITGYGLTYYFEEGNNSGLCDANDPDAGNGGSEPDARPVIDERPVEQAGRMLAVGVEREWPLGSVVAPPPYDCFGFDCGLPQQRRFRGKDIAELAYPSVALTATRDGTPIPLREDPVSLVGLSFRVMMKTDDATGPLSEDCWRFGYNGNLITLSGTEMVWANDALDASAKAHDTDLSSFQTVGRSGTTHGLAFHGRLVRPGELEIAGMRSKRGVLSSYTGHAYSVHGC